MYFFPNLFVSIFVVNLLYFCFRMFGIFPSFMVEISQFKKKMLRKERLFFEVKNLEFLREIISQLFQSLKSR